MLQYALRQEGDGWVQTFKAASKNHLQRIEEDIVLGKCEQNLNWIYRFISITKPFKMCCVISY